MNQKEKLTEATLLALQGKLLKESLSAEDKSKLDQIVKRLIKELDSDSYIVNNLILGNEKDANKIDQLERSYDDMFEDVLSDLGIENFEEEFVDLSSSIDYINDKVKSHFANSVSRQDSLVNDVSDKSKMDDIADDVIKALKGETDIIYAYFGGVPEGVDYDDNKLFDKDFANKLQKKYNKILDQVCHKYGTSLDELANQVYDEAYVHSKILNYFVNYPEDAVQGKLTESNKQYYYNIHIVLSGDTDYNAVIATNTHYNENNEEDINRLLSEAILQGIIEDQEDAQFCEDVTEISKNEYDSHIRYNEIGNTLPKFVYDITNHEKDNNTGNVSWYVGGPDFEGNMVTYTVFKNGESQYDVDHIVNNILKEFKDLKLTDKTDTLAVFKIRK